MNNPGEAPLFLQQQESNQCHRKREERAAPERRKERWFPRDSRHSPHRSMTSPVTIGETMRLRPGIGPRWTMRRVGSTATEGCQRPHEDDAESGDNRMR